MYVDEFIRINADPQIHRGAEMDVYVAEKVLIVFCSECMAVLKIPNLFAFVFELSNTDSGKILKSERIK